MSKIQILHWAGASSAAESPVCSGCCRPPAALELTVSDLLQSLGIAMDVATSGRLQVYC